MQRGWRKQSVGECTSEHGIAGCEAYWVQIGVAGVLIRYDMLVVGAAIWRDSRCSGV